MLKQEIKIKLVDLEMQRIIRDYGSSLVLGDKKVVWKINAKVQDFTVDGIEDGEPYIVDNEDTFFPQYFSRVGLEYLEKWETWKCVVEFNGTNQLITIYGKENDMREVYNEVLQFKADYEVQKEENSFVRIK